MKISKKIVLLGHFGVGKSSLIRRFVENTFSDNYKVTIGVHIFKKEILIPSGEDVSLIIWDLEGNDDINLTRPSYLIGTSGFIYVFDLSRPVTYSTLTPDIDYIKNNFPKTPYKIVGNKEDLVTKEFIKNNHVLKPFVDYYTSAKTGANVEDVFTRLAIEIIK